MIPLPRRKQKHIKGQRVIQESTQEYNLNKPNRASYTNSIWEIKSAAQSKNTVSINIKRSRYSFLISNFSSIHFHSKKVVCT